MILNLERNIYYWAPRSNPSWAASLSRIKAAEYFIDRIDAGSIHFQLSAKYFIKFERRIDEFRELIFTMGGVRGGSAPPELAVSHIIPLVCIGCTYNRSLISLDLI